MPNDCENELKIRGKSGVLACLEAIRGEPDEDGPLYEELHKYGIAIDPCDPLSAVPIGKLAHPQHSAGDLSPPMENGDGETHQSAASFACETSGKATGDNNPAVVRNVGSSGGGINTDDVAQSFARETPADQTIELSNWEDKAIVAGIRAECAAIRELDTHFPGRYHRLGVYIIETRKRLGDDAIIQILREEDIDRIRAWRAEQIAQQYKYEQAAQFPSLRAILKTLPQKQLRGKKPGSTAMGGKGESTSPQPLAIENTVTKPDAEESTSLLPLEPDFVMTEVDEAAFNTFVEATGGINRAAQVFQARRKQHEILTHAESFEKTFVEI